MMIAFIFFLFSVATAAAGSYDDLRQELVDQGWAPAPMTEETDCYYRRDVPECIKYPEIRVCAGSGLAPCIMEWRRGGDKIIVRTVGENKEVFDTRSE